MNEVTTVVANSNNPTNSITTNAIMRQVVTLLDEPVKIVLIIMLIITLIFVGEIIAEYVHRTKIKLKASKAIDAIKKGDLDVVTIINKSKLLPKHKALLLEIVKHPDLTNEMRENLAKSLLDNYNRQLNMRIKRTDMIVRLGPSFGLLGTLIPLGPGIVALASGDTATLSYSLLAAFDTTVIGLISGSVCFVLSLIRKNWYAKDNIMLTLLMEAIVEKLNEKH